MSPRKKNPQWEWFDGLRATPAIPGVGQLGRLQPGVEETLRAIVSRCKWIGLDERYEVKISYVDLAGGRKGRARTMKDHVAYLVDLGLIEKHERTNAGLRRDWNEYRLNVHKGLPQGLTEDSYGHWRADRYPSVKAQRSSTHGVTTTPSNPRSVLPQHHGGVTTTPPIKNRNVQLVSTEQASPGVEEVVEVEEEEHVSSAASASHAWLDADGSIDVEPNDHDDMVVFEATFSLAVKKLSDAGWGFEQIVTRLNTVKPRPRPGHLQDTADAVLAFAMKHTIHS